MRLSDEVENEKQRRDPRYRRLYPSWVLRLHVCLELCVLAHAFVNAQVARGQEAVPASVVTNTLLAGRDDKTNAPQSPSTSYATMAHFFSGQFVKSALIEDVLANSAIAAEQAGVFRISSSTGFSGGVSAYKMALGAETKCYSGSAPCWGMTTVAGFFPGYAPTLSKIGHEIDYSNFTGIDCPDGDEGISDYTTNTAAVTNSVRIPVSSTMGLSQGQQISYGGFSGNITVLGFSGLNVTVSDRVTIPRGTALKFSYPACDALVITSSGPGSYQYRANITIGGANKARTGILYNSGTVIGADIRSYDQSQVFIKDAGQHIDGIDGGAATYSGNAIFFPGFIVAGTTGDITQPPGATYAPIYQEALKTPRSSAAPCLAGQFTDDANFHYVCVAANKWRRVALSDF